MTYVILQKSKRKNKKYKTTVWKNNEKKTIHFGQKGASDYTKHKDKERKENYIKRHEVNEDWSDPLTAGFWSRWITWNRETINKSIRDTENRFNIQIVNRI